VGGVSDDPDPRLRALHGLGLFGCALALRAVYLWETSGSALFEIPLGDAQHFDAWARTLVAGLSSAAGSGGASGDVASEVFYQAPLYPYFLAAIYAGIDAGPWGVRWVQALLGSSACVLLAWAATRLFSRRTGLASGWLLALYPPAIYFEGLIQKPGLSAFAMSGLLALIAAFESRPRAPLALAIGVWLGGFALLRENALILVPLLGVWIALRFADTQPKRRLTWLALFAVGLALALAPVALRNRAVSGDLLITTSNAGVNFYIGNHAGADGRYAPLRPGRGGARYERRDARQLAERDLGHALSPAEVSDYWRDRALAWIRAAPGDFAAGVAHKWLLVWHAREIVDGDSIEAWREHSWLLGGLGPLLHFGVLVPLAALGIFATRKEWRRLWPLHGIWMLWSASTALFFVMARFRYPLVPVLAPFTAEGLFFLLAAVRARDARALSAGVALTAVAALASNWPLAEPRGDPRAVTALSLAIELAARGQPAEAGVELARALELEPDLAEAHMLSGELARKRGELNAALARHRKAVELAPNNAPAHNALGVSLAQSGATAAALDAYRRALALDPLLTDAENNLANALLIANRPTEAIPHYRRAIALGPEIALVHHNLGVALDSAGDPVAARRSWERASELDPDHPFPLISLSLQLASCEPDSLRDGARAQALAERAVQLTREGDARALGALAAARAELGDYSGAAELGERAWMLASRRGPPERAAELRRRVELYRSGEPLRVSCGASPD